MSADSGKLSGRVTVITGGAHGIGLAYAARYAAEGARVAVLDMRRCFAEDWSDASMGRSVGTAS